MDVRASWARIVSWCHDHVPETAAAIRPPADAALLTQAEQATSGSWPEELRAWYALADGTQRTPAGYLLPFYCPLPLQSVMSHWSMWQRIWADIAASLPNQQADALYDIARLEAQPAGTAAGMFLPSFVPIAEDQSGDDMFVDTRSGALRGCVTEFVKGDADTWGPKWPSVTAMLADLAEALHAGRPVGGWQPVINFFGPSTPDRPCARRNPPAESAGPRLGAGFQDAAREARGRSRSVAPRPAAD